MSETIKHRLAIGTAYITKDISCANCQILEPCECEETEAEFYCPVKEEYVLNPELTTCRKRRTESYGKL